MTYLLSDEIQRLLPEAEATDDRRKKWETKRNEIEQRVRALIGTIPDPHLVQFNVISERQLSDRVILQNICYSTYDDDLVSAYLLIPTGFSQKRFPAVLALHQTAACGKDEVVGMKGDHELAYGLELAERGFVVLAPDILTAGDRIFPGYEAFQTSPFEEKYPDWSMIGKMLCDHRHGVQLLSGLEYVDAERIGAIGHSLGGYNAFFLSAFEPRIRATVSSCGFSSFAGDPTPQRWGLRKEWFTHFPALSPWLARGEIPFEFNEVVALTFPRAYFNWSTQNDAIFPHWQYAGKAMMTVQELYESLEQPNKFVSLIGSGKHEFPQEIRIMAYEWLKNQLV
ncbi:dienelactone hydrolase family protein [Cohnella silvisoli]|uniref:Dienelactone hydrolase family protein n=1 Tax=Cohnella silvisoli TaxID=2873699 RepID=A0ABV1L152_9BACL|nr:dienelactone hydrolase family protein [Cohnella silvisoli]MCD9025300.1 dienelactone hydrolase family protein [Cohnella silvisoli]